MSIFIKRGLFAMTGLLAFLALGMFYETTHSANLSEVSVTLSNPRPSFRGALAAGNAEGTSQVIINDTPGDYPSTSTAQLVEGDTMRIGSAGDMGSYTVSDTIDESNFTIGSVLGSGHADSGDDVISSQSADLTVRFTTANAIQNGRFRVLVPAHDDDDTSSDGIPDEEFFDFSSSTPTVTCPGDETNYDFVAGTATASAITIDSTDYHSFECAYSGTGGVSSAFNSSTFDPILIEDLINPAPKDDHSHGTADTYQVVVQHLNDSFSVADATTVSIGVIEAVKVTASVDPLITFRILGVSSSTSACGQTTSVTTTPVEVPFGTLLIDQFRYAAQGLTVSTNAADGYAVTALANDQLGRNGDACTGDPTTNTDCIPDATATSISHTNPATWSSADDKGFGYSLDDLNTSGTTPAFEYDTSSGDCAGSECYKQFADNEDTETAQTIFSDTTPADNHNLYVCYKAIISATQAAGNYENYVTYTATATF
ncbi:MAG: hypothetical protein WDZ94_04300 [Patescibacteria group bacterium]